MEYKQSHQLSLDSYKNDYVTLANLIDSCFFLLSGEDRGDLFINCFK